MGKRNGNSRTIGWISSICGKTKLNIGLLVLVQTLLGISGVILALMLRSLVNCAVAGDKSGFVHVAIMLAVFVLLQIAVRASERFLEEYTKSTIENQLKHRLIQNILKKDYGMVSAVHSGEWMNRMTSDAVVVADGATMIIPGISGMIVKLVGALAAIMVLEPRFVFVLIPGGVLLLVLSYAFRKVLKRLHKDIQEADGSFRIFTTEHISSLLVVKSFSGEEDALLDADQLMSRHKALRMKRNHFSNICNVGFAIGMRGVYILGAIFCGYGILTGSMSYGNFTAVIQLINQVQNPFASLTGYFPKYYSMIASAERLMEIELYPDDGDGTVKPLDEVRDFYSQKMQGLGFQNARFTYRPMAGGSEDVSLPVVMKNLSFEIKKGEYIAFTGHSGCGKSTMFKLMMCLYPLDAGERYLLADERMELSTAWHRLFAFVPQGNHLMTGSIRQIVAFADKGRMNDDESIRRALAIACADEFVNELEEGIDTMLGERGQGLSEGQMQRIAIARAVFSDNPILLLDEATSALDEATEGRVLRNLKQMTDKTVLIVTHRPAALGICDRILEFTEEGVTWL